MADWMALVFMVIPSPTAPKSATSLVGPGPLPWAATSFEQMLASTAKAMPILTILLKISFFSNWNRRVKQSAFRSIDNLKDSNP